MLVWTVRSRCLLRTCDSKRNYGACDSGSLKSYGMCYREVILDHLAVLSGKSVSLTKACRSPLKTAWVKH